LKRRLGLLICFVLIAAGALVPLGVALSGKPDKSSPKLERVVFIH